MKRKLIFLPAAMAALLSVTGCGTLTTRTKGVGGPYSGFAYDIEKAGTLDEWGNFAIGNAGDVPFPVPCGLLWLVDVPLSLCLDTILLPVDLLWPRDSESDESPEDGQSVCPAHEPAVIKPETHTQ